MTWMKSRVYRLLMPSPDTLTLERQMLVFATEHTIRMSSFRVTSEEPLMLLISR